MLLLWLKLLGFMREFNERLSAFVRMLSKVLADLELFTVVLVILFLAFTHVFYLRNARRTASRFDFHDDVDGENGFRTIGSSIQTLYLLGLLGDFDAGNFPRGGDEAYLDIFIFLITIGLLNILIAIISGAYEDAMASSSRTYWR